MTEIIHEQIRKSIVIAVESNQKQIDKAIHRFCRPKNLRRIVREVGIETITNQIKAQLDPAEILKPLKAR